MGCRFRSLEGLLPKHVIEPDAARGAQQCDGHVCQDCCQNGTTPLAKGSSARVPTRCAEEPVWFYGRNVRGMRELGRESRSAPCQIQGPDGSGIEYVVTGRRNEGVRMKAKGSRGLPPGTPLPPGITMRPLAEDPCDNQPPASPQDLTHPLLEGCRHLPQEVHHPNHSDSSKLFQPSSFAGYV